MRMLIESISFRSALFGAACVAGVLLVAWAISDTAALGQGPLEAGTPRQVSVPHLGLPSPRGGAPSPVAPAQEAGPLLAFESDAGDGVRQLVLLDDRTKTLCVYHVHSKTGAVTLKSVRNIQWDQQLVEFNATAPLPQEIRTMLRAH